MRWLIDFFYLHICPFKKITLNYSLRRLSTIQIELQQMLNVIEANILIENFSYEDLVERSILESQLEECTNVLNALKDHYEKNYPAPITDRVYKGSS